ncbi:FecR family protein [Maribellus sediminis]|uniref:FecR family protein n=1 Tax=Maribellus sediminis TaxID=2696285 RepID=UPI00142FE696|nr:FecR domain-containing protein [Maribellus sediminis]
MTINDKFYRLITKELTDGLSPEEANKLQQELEKDKSAEKRQKQISHFWKFFFPQTKQHNIISKTEKKLGFTYHSGRENKLWKRLGIAATVLLVVSVGAYILTPRQHTTLNEYRCDVGEQKKVVLSDGTQVWLNSISYIVANEPFIGDKREVILFGEAYFEVAPNPDQPFIVKTPMLSTKVLGTKFNIAAMNPHARQEISLYEGKVELITDNKAHQSIIMKPGEKAFFSPESGEIEVLRTTLGKPAQWREGILYLYNEDLFSIALKLERRFKTKIFITDPAVGRLRYTAEFENEPLERIIKILCEAKAFAYEKTEGGFIIKSK